MDTAGQDKFRAITINYYKGARDLILIYEVTNIKSYVINEIKEEISEKVTIVLIGNKIDNEGERKISKKQGEKLANYYNITLKSISIWSSRKP